MYRCVIVDATGCGFDTHSRIFILIYMVSRYSAALSFAIQHAIPPEFGGKWETECVNTRFPLPTVLCAGYSVKLFLIYKAFTIFYIHHRVNLLFDTETISPFSFLYVNIEGPINDSNNAIL